MARVFKICDSCKWRGRVSPIFMVCPKCGKNLRMQEGKSKKGREAGPGRGF